MQLLSYALIVALAATSEGICSTHRTSLFCHGDVVLSQIPHRPSLRLISFTGTNGCFSVQDLIDRQPGVKIVEAISSPGLCVCLKSQIPCGVTLEDCPAGQVKGECAPSTQAQLTSISGTDLGAILGSIAVIIGGISSATGFLCFCYLKRENRSIRSESQRILSETRRSEITMTPVRPFAPRETSTPLCAETGSQNAEVVRAAVVADVYPHPRPPLNENQPSPSAENTEETGNETTTQTTPEQPKNKRRREVDFLNPAKEPMPKSSLRSGKDF